ncbi:unnamed protein product, partial [Scytosiphon promiscuus]
LQRRAFWQRCPEDSLNTRQRKVMNKFLGPFEGKLTQKKWAKIARCSPATAEQDIADLIEQRGLEQVTPAKGQTSYKLAITLTDHQP